MLDVAGDSNQARPFVRINPSNRSDEFELTIGGELSIETLGRVWPDVGKNLRQLRATRVAVDVSHLQCVDSTCLALFGEIRRLVAAASAELNFTGLTPELKALLDMAMPQEASETKPCPPPSPGFITRIGERAACGMGHLARIVTFIGELFAGFVWAAMRPRQVRWGDLATSIEKAGADAVPIVLLLGFLIGVMLAFQSAEQTERYGVRTIIPNVVAIAVTRELGPLIAMLLLAGRTGSAIAAELGTMKVNQELSALRAMGLDPVRFLAVPHVLSLMFVAPLLTLFCDLAGIVGGYTVLANNGFSIVRYAVQVGHALNWPDICGGVGKTIVGGLLVGAAGCFYGIETGTGSRAVGRSTTRAVVAAIILIVATDGCFGVIYYYFGI
ncbi:MAG TPA: ABC transporter permease [Tepidisphaeraceae bacterium]|nr:ABC transporter permease [Tepidisphaeraceae bacterium]